MLDTQGSAQWEALIPRERGTLPGGGPLARTDPTGRFGAPIVFLGVYPAATAVRPLAVDGARMLLPVAVEPESFTANSASGKELGVHYLAPLGLTRTDVLIMDMLPYFLANVSRSQSGRSMDDNIRRWEAWTGQQTGIETRPPAPDLVQIARTMPGNLERLRDYLHRCQPRLLLTLGAEAAAFVRDEAFAKVQRRVKDVLYGPPVRLQFLGLELETVHLVHPHQFIKRNEGWMDRHREWCQGRGRELAKDCRG